MVRKKATSSKNTSIFAPPVKVMMIEKNKISGKSFQKSKLGENSILQSPKVIHNESVKSIGSTSFCKSKKRKTSYKLRAVKEIRKLQGSTRLLIPRAPFSRVVKEVAQNILGKPDIKFTLLSLMALQEATEMAIVNLLEIANLCCTHAKRVTLTPADIQLTRRAFGINNPLNG